MSGPIFADRVQETTTTTGTGAPTLLGAVAGYQSFAAIGNANSCYYCETDGTNWEVIYGTYTASGTTLSKDSILASSNGGSAVTWGAGTKNVFCVVPAAVALPDFEVCNGRLTLTSGTAVTTSDVTGATTIYFTPYKGSRIGLYNGHGWVIRAFAETSIALGTLTSGKNYDVFGYDNSGVVALEFSAAWTSDTARADAIALQDGIYVKSADHTRRYLGTFRTTSTTTTEDSGGGVTTQVGGKRFLWNYYNRVERPLAVIDTTASWTYTTTTIRQANGATGNKVEFVLGQPEDVVSAQVQVAGVGTAVLIVGIGLDTVTAFSNQMPGLVYAPTASTAVPTVSPYRGLPSAGYHYLAWLERGNAGGQLYGLNTTYAQAGLIAQVLA